MSANPDTASCCFCGEAVPLSDALQIIAERQASVEAATGEAQSWFAHEQCFKMAITPEHRIFRWSE